MGRNGKSFFASIGDAILDYLGVVKAALRNVGQDNVTILSAGMVYSTLVAIVPCFTFLSAFLSAFGALQPFTGAISTWLIETFGDDTGSYIINMIIQFSRNAMSLGVMGLVSFIITGLFLVNKIYSVINNIFRTRLSGGIVKRYVVFLIFLIMFTVLLTFAIALSSTLESKLYALLGMQLDIGTVLPLVKKIGSVVAIFLAFFLLLKFVPNAKIKIGASMVGAILGTLSLYVATFVFTNIIRSTLKYSVIYGAMASVLFVLLYLYIVWYIVIIVSEITYIYQFRPDRHMLLGHPITSERQLSEAINAIVCISRRFDEGKGATSSFELSRVTGIPMSRLLSYITDFDECRLVMSTNPQNTSFVPARPAEKIMVSDVIEAIFCADILSEESVRTLGDNVAKEFKNIGTEAFRKISLAELMKIS